MQGDGNVLTDCTNFDLQYLFFLQKTDASTQIWKMLGSHTFTHSGFKDHRLLWASDALSEKLGQLVSSKTYVAQVPQS